MNVRRLGSHALAAGAIGALLLLLASGQVAAQTSAFMTTTAVYLQEPPMGGRSPGSTASWPAAVEYCHSAAGWTATRDTRITLRVMESPGDRLVQLSETEFSVDPRVTGPEVLTCHELPFRILVSSNPGGTRGLRAENVTIRAVADANSPLYGSEANLSFEASHPPMRSRSTETFPAETDGDAEAYHVDRGGPLRGYGAPLALVLAGAGGLVLRRRFRG